MGLRLNDLIQGAATAGAAGMMEGFKADIMAERDAALAKMRGEERALDRQSRTDERVAGQEFTAGESALSREARASESAADIEARSTSAKTKADAQLEKDKLDRASRKEVAGIRSGSNTGKKIIPGQGIYDWDTKELEPFPEKTGDRKERALKMALVDVESEANEDTETGNKVETVQQMSARYYKEMSPDKEEDKDTSAVVFTHSVHGDITEDDITETMSAMKLTRQQVLDRLGK